MGEVAQPQPVIDTPAISYAYANPYQHAYPDPDAHANPYANPNTDAAH